MPRVAAVCVVCVVAVVVGVVCGSAQATTASPQTASEMVRSQQVKMVTSAPRPEALVLLKDCPVYVLGELRGVKKHGETWFNDGSACEFCKCVDGQKRCYYHYCNERLTEGFMTPPSGRPPLDDEDRDEGLDEGSGHQPIPDDYYKVINHIPSVDGWALGGGGNEAEATPMCSGKCEKNCPWGYKVDKDRGCLRCKCHKCPSMTQCHERCLGGLVRDARGCQVCKCRRKDLSLLPPPAPHHPQHPTAPHHTPGRSPPAPAVNAHNHPHHNGHSKEDCNDTDGGVSSPGEDGVWGDANNLLDTDSHGQRSSDDGTTKSAVQASPVEWWQVWVIATPLVLAAVVVCGAAMRFWRRYHHDKYRINEYRPTEKEKLRPVTTAEDHHHHHNHHHNHHIPHL